MIVLVPLALATGLSVIVRFAPLPLSTMPLVATTLRSDDVAVTVSAVAAVSASPNVNGIAPVAVSSNVVRAEISLIVGAVVRAERLTKSKNGP